MLLTNEQMQIVEKYVDETLIDKEKLIQYLEKHRIIKNEIFARCSKVKKAGFGRDEAYCFYLDSEKGYRPVNRETFIRRIPFYFFTVMNSMGIHHYAPLFDALHTDSRDLVSDNELEEIYVDLEFMFYNLQLPLNVIFGYVRSQLYPPPIPRKRLDRGRDNRLHFESVFSDIATGAVSEKSRLSVREVYVQWRHYLRLCLTLGWDDYTPERFISAYNYALEAVGLEPVIYYPSIFMGLNTHTTDRNVFVFKGNFPCDTKGKPILRWTNLKVTYPQSVTFNGPKSHFGELTIVASPKSKIYERGLEYDEENHLHYNVDSQDWECIYVGPQNMSFDYRALKAYREECDLTQKELAEAISVSVRTYQKWEAGSTMPDCNNLIRIMHWLGIRDVQQLIVYDEE